MALFGYRGVTAAGAAARGIREAETPRDLRAALRRESVFLTESWEMGREEKARGRLQKLRLPVAVESQGRITRIDIMTVTRQLATLAAAGVPLVEALSAVIDQADKPSLKAMLTGIRTSVNEGESLSAAVGRYPKHFTGVFVNMVNAGEQSGTLELVLSRLADFMENQSKVRSKIISATAYPVIMVVFGIIIMFILMTAVVPRVAAVFEDFDKVLPWYTRLLIVVSNTFRDYWWIIFPSLGAAVGGFFLWKRRPAGRARWHRAVLGIPVFGELVLMLAMGRFAQTLGTLLSSGVQVLKALEITKYILGNLELEKVIDAAIVAVREGQPIHEAIQRSKKFPPLVTKMIAVGEKSGDLEKMLRHVASFYEARSDAKIALLTSLLEPLLILSVAVGTGGVAFAILAPLLKMNQFVG